MFRLYYLFGEYENRGEHWEDFNTIDEAMIYIEKHSWEAVYGYEIEQKEFYPIKLTEIQESTILKEKCEEFIQAKNRGKEKLEQKIKPILEEKRLEQEARDRAIYENLKKKFETNL